MVVSTLILLGFVLVSHSCVHCSFAGTNTAVTLKQFSLPLNFPLVPNIHCSNVAPHLSKFVADFMFV